MRLWYFFMGTGAMAIAGLFFFASFALWHSGRYDGGGSPRPMLVVLNAAAGLAFLGLCVWLYSL
ncbi:hypothetical protein ABZ614_04380 [Streptomyces sp. NPDC013178]|uniref:hypothetical protein n=1 Tax=unclassified Streptomyces TaxID=2593676 RepID=UPI0034039B8F